MGKKCWDINPNCLVVNWKPGGSAFQEIKRGEAPKCLAHRLRKGCWEVDWVSEIGTLPDEAKEYCKQRMQEKCPKCPVYADHKEELKAIIKKVQEA